jgi:arginyl-tRNA synthetase
MTFYDLILSALQKKLCIDNLSIESPKEKSFGDFATTIAMQLAKSEHKNPREIAEKLITQIREIDFVESADIAGAGFINIKIKDSFITDAVNKNLSFEKSKSLVIDMDYGAYNVAKELHIGHLRTSIVGDTIYRISKFLGHKPISYNHIGDWGRPMAMIIAWIIQNKLDINEKDLNGYYPAATAWAKEHPEFLEHAQQIKKDFQDGNPEYVAIYEKFLKISMDMMHRAVVRLNIIPFDNDLGERNAAKYLDPVEKILTDKKLLKKSDGATIVELKRDTDTAPMPPFMFLDSRGADTYDSTDLAAMYYRKITDNPDKIIYFTDARQRLHFEQLFRVAELSDIFSCQDLEHQYFGSITGTDGKPFKTRDGNVATLFDIIDTVESAVTARDNSLPFDTVKMIALAALKFNDLMHDVKSDYVFDPNAVTSFEGRTGPYILYSAVRLNSVLKKAGAFDIKTESLDLDRKLSSDERDLLMKILEFPRIIEMTFDKRAPSMLANYTYDLCQLVNAFYHSAPIKDDLGRIAITKIAVKTLSACIDLMGLKIPDEM